MADAAAPSPGKHAPAMRAYGYLAFIVGLCLTVWVCLYVADAQQQQIALRFQRDCDKVQRDTEVRLQTYFDMLLSIKGMYALEDRIERGQFRRFIGQLDLAQRYPGFQAIQFVRRVAPDGLAGFAEAVRQDRSDGGDGFPQFRVHPANARGEHYVIEYTEPLKGNENAFGLDLAALPPHLRALRLGADSGAIVATERITLVQDASGQPGFVARAPVYRNGAALHTVEQRRAALVGFVAIVFRVNTLMREVVEPALLQNLRVRVNDAGYLRDGGAAPANQDNLMFDSAGQLGAKAAASAPAAPGLSTRLELSMGERRWVLRFEGRGGPRYSRDPAAVGLIAVAGFIISTLIAALLVAWQRRRELSGQLGQALEEQRALQESLITAEKMASLGALVAGIAHELNTPIGNSLLTATALSDMAVEFERKLSGEGGVKRSVLQAHLGDVRQACAIMAGSLARAAELITSFKQVAVDQASGQRRRFRLDELLHDTLATYAVQLRRANCTVRLDVAADLEFDSYPGSLGQVLSNLLNNALLHGFEGRDSGTITISARREDDGMVRLALRDDGSGMAPATLRRVFDPFFTTKMGQGGSGLGMNIVYNIVGAVLKGKISIDSAPGEGTTVVLTLPLALPAAVQPPPRLRLLRRGRGRSGRAAVAA
ncbi:CHASE domain-containing protein [Rugamonas sp. DEMB1]|uniref:CHASE domain-containing protein n=1 Tax=Rugamonas sp. DEMB1 TaxID=3039386 RepID=UPI00244BAEA1|nr:CHASE domain-containing protein [Rugamonas sp. DEMB1]WGG51471.1 CHASE domain-containing protein [Rugamonas sp. DEMB1]